MHYLIWKWIFICCSWHFVKMQFNEAYSAWRNNKRFQISKKKAKIDEFSYRQMTGAHTRPQPHTEDSRSLTCYRVWSWHHEWRGCLRWIWNGSLRRVDGRRRCSCWGVSLRLVIYPGRGVSSCGCGPARVFFCHRWAGVCSHAMCEAMVAAAPQAAIFTPLQARAAAVIILWRTGYGGWVQRTSKQARETRLKTQTPLVIWQYLYTKCKSEWTFLWVAVDKAVTITVFCIFQNTQVLYYHEYKSFNP